MRLACPDLASRTFLRPYQVLSAIISLVKDKAGRKPFKNRREERSVSLSFRMTIFMIVFGRNLLTCFEVFLMGRSSTALVASHRSAIQLLFSEFTYHSILLTYHTLPTMSSSLVSIDNLLLSLCIQDPTCTTSMSKARL